MLERGAPVASISSRIVMGRRAICNCLKMLTTRSTPLALDDSGEDTGSTLHWRVRARQSGTWLSGISDSCPAQRMKQSVSWNANRCNRGEGVAVRDSARDHGNVAE